MLRFVAMVACLNGPALAANDETQPGQSHAGEVYEIRREVNSSSTGSGGSTSNSHDEDIIVERVIGVRDAGEELEFDLPDGTSAEDRARDWNFPVRVLRPPHGPLQLLNGPELESRLDNWLRSASLTQEACGHWYFTWNAFQIECDPQSVVQALEPLNRWPDDLRDGAPYEQAEGRAPVTLGLERHGTGGAAFVARMEIDPEAVRRERARQDVVVAELMHRSLTFEAALSARSAEQISGTITTTFEVLPGRNMRRRTTVTELETSGGEGREHETVTETVERRLLSARVPAISGTAH